MKKILARIIILSRPEVKDAFGQTKLRELHARGHSSVISVEAGKTIEIEFEGVEKPDVERQVRDMCEKFLTNPVTETFTFTLEEILPKTTAS